MPVEELNPAVSMLSRSNSPVHIIDTKGQLTGLLKSFSVQQKKKKKKKQHTFELLTYGSRKMNKNIQKRSWGHYKIPSKKKSNI